MKKSFQLILLFCAIISFPGLLIAQQPEQCATVSYNKAREQKNPALFEQRKKINELVRKILNEKNNGPVRGGITIPVVVHVLYRTNIENISDAQIQSQIDVLNEDFGRTNADTTMTPAIWQSVAANTGIQFCLASRKPNGDWTNGIERRQTTNFDWQPDDAMKFYTTGGLDAWDPTSYLNIWVCNLVSPFLGYTTLPTAQVDSFYDGTVILSRAFGRIAFVSPPFDRGRTTTHEIGHWLGLQHIWGDDGGSCLGTDSVMDTPNQADATQGCPTFPVYDACSFPSCEATHDPGNPCSSYGIMFMNYMDYTYDACMNMFTNGQGLVMNATIAAMRPTLFTSLGCSAPIGIDDAMQTNHIQIYPNPAQTEITISCSSKEELTLSVFNAAGQEVFAVNKFSCYNSHRLNISCLEAGVYFIKLRGENSSSVSRLVVLR
jgi:hypothetical protein